MGGITILAHYAKFRGLSDSLRMISLNLHPIHRSIREYRIPMGERARQKIT